MLKTAMKTTCAALALALALQPVVASAQQQNGEWFVPGQQHPAARPVQAAPGPRANPVPGPMEPEAAQAPINPAQFKLPPAPDVPTLPKGQATPAAIVGILSVPDVLRVSTAYAAVTKELNVRGQKLNEDVQKEQNALRELAQAFANERAKMSPEQIRAKEKELQDRATEAQRRFGERNRIIQEAGQYATMQINRSMEQVAQAVALSRGVNIVLNRAQILGTTADFDLTPQVAQVLNQILPAVLVPPDGVSALSMNPEADAAKAGATKASAPASAAPAPAKPQKK